MKKRKLFTLLVFAVAFAFIEASVVFYLRNFLGYRLNYPLGSYQTLFSLGFISFITTQNPILGSIQIARAEVVREFSTIILLACVAYLSAKNLKQKIGVFLIIFSLWDIFYYIFLKLLTGWPTSLLNTDIYFLIPVAWIGPVITPLIISVILLLIGLKLYTDKSKNS